jgi:competence ComEA-like helix-hairpin-helix protein
MIDLNAANTDDLKQVYGVGNKLSARIIKYREMLGGFYDFDQLKEVYYLPDSTIDRIRDHFTLENPILQTISINDEQHKLETHPYLNRSLVKAIISYRKVHGSFTKIEDLKNIHIISDSSFAKIRPYLTTDL